MKANEGKPTEKPDESVLAVDEDDDFDWFDSTPVDDDPWWYEGLEVVGEDWDLDDEF